MILKEKLHTLCQEFVNSRLKNIHTSIYSHQKALQSETKSSAGDKHETGRAMLQLEIEKAGKQLENTLQMKTVLSKIDLKKETTIACLGSILYTNKNNYFLSVSTGKITVNKVDYFAISTQSPLGKIFLGKQKNDTIFWNNSPIKILSMI